jgi:hypothetical protein
MTIVLPADVPCQGAEQLKRELLEERQRLDQAFLAGWDPTASAIGGFTVGWASHRQTRRFLSDSLPSGCLPLQQARTSARSEP